MTVDQNIKIVEYNDETKDDFSGIERDTIEINRDFVYIKKNIFWRIASFIVYRLIMTPIAFFYCKIKFSHKIVNKHLLKKCKGKGFFMYGNHTLFGGDAFIPSLITFPRKAYVVVHPDNLSVFGLKNFLMMNGAIPTPTKLHATKNFRAAIEKRVVEHNAVIIYPEAHVWPYCTKIRRFASVSFDYPVQLRDPVYTFTNTFSKRRFFKTPKVTTYIDGPFFPDINLPEAEQKKNLADEVYAVMVHRAKNNTYERVRYVKGGENND